MLLLIYYIKLTMTEVLSKSNILMNVISLCKYSYWPSNKQVVIKIIKLLNKNFPTYQHPYWAQHKVFFAQLGSFLWK